MIYSLLRDALDQIVGHPLLIKNDQLHLHVVARQELLSYTFALVSFDQ